mmetsp:Transcript_1095/g.1083  ORF Transcript_1095/g.1083 Transcript_1095/m.1083 type:complete len:121 (-) Transcript_1095:163-525(-)
MIEEFESKDSTVLPLKILKVVTGTINTLVMTDSGDLLIFGSDEYGQTGRSKEQKDQYEKEHKLKRKDQLQRLNFLSTPIQITIPHEKKIKIIDIAMGSHHILALSKFYEVYSWGRNDDGQ